MDIALLLKSIAGLSAVLVVLIFLLYLPTGSSEKKEKKKKHAPGVKVRANTDFEHLKNIIKDKNSTKEQLQEAAELIIKHHGTMHKKLGMRAHPESDAYMDILFKLCRHKNTSKSIVLQFNKDLEKINPEYKKEINDALMRGLNSRGV